MDREELDPKVSWGRRGAGEAPARRWPPPRAQIQPRSFAGHCAAAASSRPARAERPVPARTHLATGKAAQTTRTRTAASGRSPSAQAPRGAGREGGRSGGAPMPQRFPAAPAHHSVPSGRRGYVTIR